MSVEFSANKQTNKQTLSNNFQWGLTKLESVTLVDNLNLENKLQAINEAINIQTFNSSINTQSMSQVWELISSTN